MTVGTFSDNFRKKTTLEETTLSPLIAGLFSKKNWEQKRTSMEIELINVFHEMDRIYCS